MGTQTPGTDTLSIRTAVVSDLETLTAIYNHYVRETPVTFDLEPFGVDVRRSWLDDFGVTGRYRLLVAEEAGVLLGYAYSHRFRGKAAYDRSVETTIYLDPEATGKGVGRCLYEALFEELASEDVHLALAGITLPNPASQALHLRLGFEPVGVFKEVGYKFGRYWDVVWMQKPVR